MGKTTSSDWDGGNVSKLETAFEEVHYFKTTDGKVWEDKGEAELHQYLLAKAIEVDLYMDAQGITSERARARQKGVVLGWLKWKANLS